MVFEANSESLLWSSFFLELRVCLLLYSCDFTYVLTAGSRCELTLPLSLGTSLTSCLYFTLVGVM